MLLNPVERAWEIMIYAQWCKLSGCLEERLTYSCTSFLPKDMVLFSAHLEQTLNNISGWDVWQEVWHTVYYTAFYFFCITVGSAVTHNVCDRKFHVSDYVNQTFNSVSYGRSIGSTWFCTLWFSSVILFLGNQEMFFSINCAFWQKMVPNGGQTKEWFEHHSLSIRNEYISLRLSTAGTSQFHVHHQD